MGTYLGVGQKNPTGPSSGDQRVLRDGSWEIEKKYLRSADRDGEYPGKTYYDYGFRIVLPLNDLKGNLPVVRADPDIRIEISTNKPDTNVFHNNEKIRIYVRSTRDGYLRLFYRQADNQWVPLTLDAGKKVYDLRAATEYTFPKHDEAGYPIETPPAGEETILALVSSIPFDGLAPQTDTDLAQKALARLPLNMLRRENDQFRGIRNPEDVPVYNSSSLKIFTIK